MLQLLVTYTVWGGEYFRTVVVDTSILIDAHRLPAHELRNTMDAQDIVLGNAYKIDSPSAKGWWTVMSVYAGKLGEELVDAQDRQKKTRTFRVEQVIDGAKKERTVNGEVVSESVRKVGVLKDGTEIWTENVLYMPLEKRRGRKPLNG